MGGERCAGQCRAQVEQAFLHGRRVGGRVDLPAMLVVEVLTAYHRRGSSLVASHACVTGARLRSSGAPGPPILVATQPGSSALEKTPGQRRATANASTTSKSLLSE